MIVYVRTWELQLEERILPIYGLTYKLGVYCPQVQHVEQILLTKYIHKSPQYQQKIPILQHVITQPCWFCCAWYTVILRHIKRLYPVNFIWWEPSLWLRNDSILCNEIFQVLLGAKRWEIGRCLPLDTNMKSGAKLHFTLSNNERSKSDPFKIKVVFFLFVWI